MGILYLLILMGLFLLEGTTKIHGGRKTSRSKQMSPQINGRLLRPEEGCGITDAPTVFRIIGGSEAEIGAWPWMALLGYIEYDEIHFYCDGSLITSRHVLTAAHCLYTSNLKFVRLGEHNIKTTNDGSHDDIAIVRSRPHELYNINNKPNDIAILYLARDATFSDRIRVICLPFYEPIRSRNFGYGDNPWIAGWGRLSKYGDSSHVLMQLQVPIVNNRVCRELHLMIGAPEKLVDNTIKDHVICAGMYPGQSMWKGDSGGPLMLSIPQNGTSPFYQIGIISCSFGCAREFVPAIYSKVQYYIDWIKRHVEE